MKNLFRENRVVWEKADEPAKVEGGGVAGAQIVETPEQTREKAEAKAKINRDTLLEEIKLKKEILYKRVVDSFKDKEIILDKEGFKNAFKRDVWNAAVAMDDELWKDVEIGFDEATDIWQPDSAMAAFATHGKKNDVLADMFVGDVLAQVEKDGAVTSAVTVTLQYDNGLKVTKVEKKEEVKPAEEKKKDEHNYDAMADVILGNGVTKFIVTGLMMFGLIPAPKEGQTIEEAQRLAVIAGLKGEDSTLAVVFDWFGLEGGCKGTAQGLRDMAAGTMFEDTLQKVESGATRYNSDKVKKVIDEANKAARMAKGPQVAPKKVLAQVEIDKLLTAPKEGVRFATEELVSDKYDLEITIPPEQSIDLGTSMVVTVDGVNGPQPQGEIKAGTDRNTTVLVASGTPISPNTVLREGVMYRYVAKKKEAPETATT